MNIQPILKTNTIGIEVRTENKDAINVEVNLENQEFQIKADNETVFKETLPDLEKKATTCWSFLRRFINKS